MEVTFPAYYPAFACTADRCRDNCCRTGWEIDVDERTAAYYDSLPEPQRSRLLAGLGRDEEGTCVIVPVDGQCPFLTENGLCSLVLELGEEHIGEICALHPRYREWFPGRMEIGVGLCCEEAARLILSEAAPAEFETLLTDEDDEEEDAPLYLPLLALRDRLFAIVQNRDLPLNRRMAQALRLAHAVQQQVNRGALPDADVAPSELEAAEGDAMDVLPRLLALHTELEVLEPAWLDAVEQAQETAETANWHGFFSALGERVYEYEHLMVYLLFRYFLKAVYDEKPLEKVQLAVVMTLTMLVLGAAEWQKTGRFGLTEQIEVTRQYSKEVEYSDDNMEALKEALLFEPELSTASLLGLLEAE